MQVRRHELKQVRLPEIDQAFLDSIEFESLASLREAVHDALKRRNQSQQRQALREQVLQDLLGQTPFALPPELVSREEINTVRRLVRELRQQGMSDNDIRPRGRDPGQCPRVHPPVAQGIPAAGQDRRGRGDHRRRLGRQHRARGDGREHRRERPPHPPRLDKEGLTEDL